LVLALADDGGLLDRDLTVSDYDRMADLVVAYDSLPHRKTDESVRYCRLRS